jgi:threonine 3-dehydrogenase
LKAILKEREGEGLTMKEVPEPTRPGPTEVIVKVKRVSICGTDVHIYNWDEWAASRMKPPVIIGHELAGEIVEKGDDVEGLEVGDYVSAESHIFCGHCYQCRTGRAHICQNLKILGVDVNGVFAEYAKLPARILWKVSPEIDPIFASVMEPFGNAVHTVTVEDLTGKTVLITGAGPIGLMGIQVAKAEGASLVIVSEVKEYRIKLAKENGADVVINPLEKDLAKEVKSLTNGEGVDAFFEMSGNPNALRQGLEALTPGGVVAILGVFPGNSISFDINNLFTFKGVKAYGITGRRIFETWRIADQLLKSKRVDLSKVVTHVLPFDEWEKGIELMRKGESGKIVLEVS